jgi:predicted PurR-regulated permease PerM
VLQPLITGKQVSLHPVVMALVVAAGSVVGGLLGAVVAVPLTAVSWAVFSTLRRTGSDRPASGRTAQGSARQGGAAQGGAAQRVTTAHEAD